jgi:hypothetical protein
MATKLATTKSTHTGNGEHGKGNMTDLQDTSHELKDGIVLSLSGLSAIESDIAALVRKTVTDTLRVSGSGSTELVNVVHHVVMGAIDAAEQVGTGLTMSIKSVATGIVMGVHDVGGDVVTASYEVMRSVIKHTAAVGSDLGTVARRAVDGVMQATVDIGGNVAQVGKSAIKGAIEEAGIIGNMAVRTVKDVLSGILNGLGESSSEHSHDALASHSTSKKSHAGTSAGAKSH